MTSAVVGRADELGRLSDLVREAGRGHFGAAVVSGVAGVGKTTLLRAAVDQAGAGALVLSGACLPLTAVPVPLIGLRSAVRGLPRSARPAVLDETGVEPGAEPAPGHPPVPVALDDWLSDLAARQPLVLTVDDLQWADAATLDALLYLVAGPADRAMAVLVTVRSDEVGHEHPLSRWLADVRRLPHLAEVELGPLDREEVGLVVEGALASAVHSSLVDEVHARSGGNPYLATLLVAGVDPSARSLPPHLPDRLSTAVLRPWPGLPAATRAVLLALAVGGRPSSGSDLRLLGDVAGVDDPAPALAEAVAAGMLEVGPDGTHWFRHPLQAEALEHLLSPAERCRLHAAFAAGLAPPDQGGDAGPDAPPRLAEAVSDHHLAAGDTAAAYRWATRAAAALHDAGDPAGALRMTRRVASLWSEAADPDSSHVDLLEAVRVLARRVGDWEAELDAVEGLRREVSPDEEPLRVAALDTWAEQLRYRLDLDPTPEGLTRADALTAGAPHSWQRALVLVEHSRRLVWQGDLAGARAAARAACAVGGNGRAGGDEEPRRARGRAMAQDAMVATFEGDTAAARERAASAMDVAAGVPDGVTMMLATMWGAGLQPYPAEEWLDHIVRGRRRMEECGVPAPFVARLSGDEALGWFVLGRPDECRARLRVGLGAGATPRGNGGARLTAAVLASWQGRPDEALAHLERAREVLGREWSHPASRAEVTAATVLLGAGDAEGAARVVEDALERGTSTTRGCEWLAPLGARALADLAVAAPDPAPVLRRLDALRERAPHVLRGPGGGAPYEEVLAAADRLYDAECARALRDPDAAGAWTQVVERLERVTLPWTEAYARWRAGEALLTRGGAGERHAAAELLRSGHALAARLGAAPVLESVEGLARTARIRLDVVAPPDVDGGRVPGVAGTGLTRREQEVLAHVVAGRTYAEIARDLFLSEKTVSSHISNILRKTGTANRVDLAAWAGRAQRPG